MPHYLLTAAGRDRPGLVAAVSKMLFDEKCNLEDSAMTRLQGEFAILLIFSGPPAVSALNKKLASLGRRLSLMIHLKPLSTQESSTETGRADRVLVSVYGADRPGIVHRVTRELADAKVNLTDLSTHRTRPESGPCGYILYLEGEVPPSLSSGSLQKRLRTKLKTLDVTVTVKALPSEAL